MKVRPYFTVGPRAGCIVRAALLAAVLLVAARLLSAQVDAVAHLRGTDLEFRVANPTQQPFRVTIQLYRDSTLTDTVAARISPASFTLVPGAEQVVRLRLRAKPATSARYRLTTLFLPVTATEPPRPTVKLVLATRIVTRVEAGP